MDDGFGALPTQERGDRPPRVPLKAIENVNPDIKIPIFYKTSRNAPTLPLIKSFSREALTVFSDRARRELQDGAKLFTITGGDKQAIKDVLDWIMSCVAEQKAVNFQTYDDTIPDLFSKYARAIEVASYLEVPARDFSEGLTKRLVGIARKKSMSWDEVEHFYEKYEDNGLREVAAAAVFFAWWRGDLDEQNTADEMCFLSVLREQWPALDDDLHEWARKNEEGVRAKWAKKDEEKRGDSGLADGSGFVKGGSSGEGWPGTEQKTAIAATSDWETAATIGGSNWDTPAGTGGKEWDTENIAPSGGTSDLNTPVPTSGGASWDDNDAPGNDWAEEVNEAAQPAPTW